jgi:hypothetical protein
MLYWNTYPYYSDPYYATIPALILSQHPLFPAAPPSHFTPYASLPPPTLYDSFTFKMSSFLQDLDSSYTPSVTADSVAACRTRTKGKKTSAIWAYNCEPLDHENQKLLYCAYYDIDDKPHGANNASSMTKHIRRQHKTVIIEKGFKKSCDSNSNGFTAKL